MPGEEEFAFWREARKSRSVVRWRKMAHSGAARDTAIASRGKHDCFAESSRHYS
jgi:hypothetical protein